MKPEELYNIKIGQKVHLRTEVASRYEEWTVDTKSNPNRPEYPQISVVRGDKLFWIGFNNCCWWDAVELMVDLI